MIKTLLRQHNIVPEHFASNLVFPGASLLQGPVEINGSGTGAIDYTAAAIPALIWMEDDRRFTFLRIRYIHIYLTNFDTFIAPDTYLRVKYDLSVRSRDIW